MAILRGITVIGYHLAFFARINPVAPVFAAFFVLQGVLTGLSAAIPLGPREDLARPVAAAILAAVPASAVMNVLSARRKRRAAAGLA